jgi:hypothetical protein
VRHQHQPTSPPAGTNNSQIAANSGVLLQPLPSGAPFLCPMPVCGRRAQRWSGETRAQVLIHLRSKVHEHERVGHLTLASIGSKYCDNCGELRSVLGRYHGCKRHLGSQTANTAWLTGLLPHPSRPRTPQPSQIKLPAGPLHSLPKPCALRGSLHWPPPPPRPQHAALQRPCRAMRLWRDPLPLRG